MKPWVYSYIFTRHAQANSDIMRIRVKAFGCKLNQCEAGAIESALAAAGHRVVRKPPYDAALVCGCTVTVRADYKVRQFLRRMARKHGVSRLFLSGCSAVSFSDEVVAELGIEKLFARNDPAAVVEYLGGGEGAERSRLTFAGRTRGYVKIQDGCNQFCSYCIVPHVRGRERSVPPEEVIERIRELADSGIKEAVLTGVHDGRYSHSGLDLAGLCRRILRETDIPRIRLSSIESTEITDGLVEILTDPRMAPHLHVPLQSGSDSVLRRMGRRYTGAEYLEVVRRLRRMNPDMGIGADVIVGFPGETGEEYRQTRDLIESSPLSYLHVFRYSPRPGTEAAEMENRVHNETKRERMEELREIHENLRREFALSQVGKVRKVIVERVRDGVGGGWTGNYLRAGFPASPELEGKMIEVRVENYENGEVICRIEDSI